MNYFNILIVLLGVCIQTLAQKNAETANVHDGIEVFFDDVSDAKDAVYYKSYDCGYNIDFDIIGGMVYIMHQFDGDIEFITNEIDSITIEIPTLKFNTVVKSDYENPRKEYIATVGKIRHSKQVKKDNGFEILIFEHKNGFKTEFSSLKYELVKN
ncbi:MAG: hypothetical protein NW207_00110 [Cytophagales bacterium]|nr:hypothetical protein [Cytophagales bacterium]